jgi:hypothetical protein
VGKVAGGLKDILGAIPVIGGAARLAAGGIEKGAGAVGKAAGKKAKENRKRRRKGKERRAAEALRKEAGKRGLKVGRREAVDLVRKGTTAPEAAPEAAAGEGGETWGMPEEAAPQEDGDIEEAAPADVAKPAGGFLARIPKPVLILGAAGLAFLGWKMLSGKKRAEKRAA